jgi:hypothetical protein
MFLRCTVNGCKGKPVEHEETVPTWRVGLVALWFHSFHEGHLFEYWEDGVKLLPGPESDQGIEVTATCARLADGCKQKPESITAKVLPHQITMPVLQLHTQHGNCGITVSYGTPAV